MSLTPKLVEILENDHATLPSGQMPAYGERDLLKARLHVFRITRETAKNFYYSFLLIPIPKRRALYAIYAFARRVDDIADLELPGSGVPPRDRYDRPERIFDIALTKRLAKIGIDPAEALIEWKRETLGQVRADLEAMYRGEPTDDPIFMALQDTAYRFAIPMTYFLDLVSGMESDLIKSRFQTREELEHYFYQVAGTVGLITGHVFGFRDPKGKEYAVEWGHFMQQVNIMRDVAEDASRDRIYLPLDELAQHDYTAEELLAGEHNKQFVALMRHQYDVAKGHLERAVHLFRFLPRDTRFAPAVMMALYASILEKIRSRDFDVHSQRIRLSTPRKIGIALKVWFKIGAFLI